MTIDTLKHRYLKIQEAIRTKYWPRAVHYLETKSPIKLFLRALLIGLLLSIPWQCTRLFFTDYMSEAPVSTSEINSNLSLPKFGNDSITNMPNPKARRPIPEQIESIPSIVDQPSQIEIIESSNTNTIADQEARILKQTTPDYPASSLRKHESGTVLIQVIIDANGEVKDTSVKQSSNYRSLDRAARKAVAKWKFSPRILNGQAVESELLIPIEYKSE